MNNSPETRLSLIGRLHDAGDSDAWSEFVQIYEPLILTVVMRRGLQHADAVEVTQEVLSRVAKSIETWDPNPKKGAFRGWLYRVTRNLTIDFLRRNRPLPKADGDSVFDLDQIASPSQDESREFRLEYERRLFHWAGSQVRRTVKSHTWEAFWQTTVQGRSAEDVATQLEIKVGSVYVARSRVMAKIEGIISKRLDETSEH